MVVGPAWLMFTYCLRKVYHYCLQCWIVSLRSWKTIKRYLHSITAWRSVSLWLIRILYIILCTCNFVSFPLLIPFLSILHLQMIKVNPSMAIFLTHAPSWSLPTSLTTIFRSFSFPFPDHHILLRSYCLALGLKGSKVLIHRLETLLTLIENQLYVNNNNNYYYFSFPSPFLSPLSTSSLSFINVVLFIQFTHSLLYCVMHLN